jgi:outer membrane protein assembly factor BamB
MPVPARRRSVLALFASAALAGCSALATTKNCDFDYSAPTDGWPLPGRDPKNSHAAPAGAAPALADASSVWSVEFRRSLGPVVVSDGVLYLPSHRVDTDEPQGEEPPPAVFAVDADTGERVWQHDVVYEAEPGQASLRRAIAVDDERVYAVQRTFDEAVPNRLIAVERATGDRAWMHEGLRASGIHLGADVVFARTNSAVKAIDTATGDVCRRFHDRGVFDRLLDARTPQVRPAIAGDTLFVASVRTPDGSAEPWRYWLSGIDLRTGDVAWTSDPFAVEEYVPHAVVADAERVYVPAANRLAAFDHGGAELWRTPVVRADRSRRRPPLIEAVATNGSRLFLEVSAADDADGIYGVDPTTGEVVWDRSDLYGDPVVAGDVVYTGRSTSVGEDEDVSVLSALDGATGEALDSYQFDAALDGPPRLVDGRVYARTVSFEEQSNDGQPTFRLHSVA